MSNKYPGGLITSGANAGYSVAFDGTGDYLTTPSSANLSVGAGDFSIEAWVYFTGSPASAMIFTNISSNDTQLAFRIDASNFPKLQGWNTNFVTSSTTVAQNQWYHLVCCRVSNSTSIFINGTRTANATVTNNFSSTNAFTIGGTASADYLNGYISNLRVVKGSSPYDPTQTTIRVPTQLLNITNTQLLTCNSPAIVDQSSNNFTITANGNAAVSTFTPFTGTQLVPNPNTLANTQGVWSISDAAYWMSQNKWPMPPNYPLQSLRFNSADSTYLNRTPAVNGNRQIWTFSGWVKRSSLGAIQNLIRATNVGVDDSLIRFESSDAIGIYTNAATNLNLQTTAVYRDLSAWYHIVVAVDTTQATASNRAKLYVNGTQVTVFSTETYCTQNTNTQFNSTSYSMNIGRYQGNLEYFNGYMADINWIDGQALTPSSFGANDPNTGVWSPVPYSGTYGTNGFRLSFQNNTGTTATTLGRDYSGNGNNWTPNNFSVAAGSGNDSLTDGPTNWGIDYGNGGEVRGNYCTLNSLDNGGNTIANGNLDSTRSGSSWVSTRSTLGMSSGKWYWEITAGAGVSSSNQNVVTVGLMTSAATLTSYPGSDANGWGYNSFDGRKYNNQSGGTGTGTTYGATWTTGDIIGVAFDADAGSLTFYKNGVSQGAAYTSLVAGTYFAAVGSYASSSTLVSLNFGQRPFAYPAPSGFKVLCTTNLPIPTVGATSTTLANKYFDATLYTGNATTNAITNAGGFQPDLVWAKSRADAYFHGLYDVIRGTGTTKSLYSNSTDPEGTYSANQNLVSFNSNGFTLGATSSTNAINSNGTAHVAWQWKAGGTGIANTSGSISSTVSANTTAGISIVGYTGTGAAGTVGHGLGVAPRMIINKIRSAGSTNWVVYHASLGATQYLELNTTVAATSAVQAWNNTAPTSSVFSVNTYTSSSSNTHIAYCFAEIAGFSRFSSYTGNSSTDGPFVYCGFRPRFIMIKRSDSATFNWWMEDSARDTYNVAGLDLAANLAAAEQNDTPVLDMLSNGFKLRTSSYTGFNQSGGTYIFAAFAESPFNYSRAR